ncbi:MAG: hypothetical protein ACLPTF_03930 [Steroidobacteraceae bacterium]
MQNLKAITLSAIGAAALTITPLTPAAAGSHWVGGRGFHHFGVVGAIASAIVGVATLPLAIASAVASTVEPPQYAPPPPAYYPPPAPYYGGVSGYYAPAARYYPRPPGYYAPRARYNPYPVYQAAPRSGYYPYRR